MHSRPNENKYVKFKSIACNPNEKTVHRLSQQGYCIRISFYYSSFSCTKRANMNNNPLPISNQTRNIRLYFYQKCTESLIRNNIIILVEYLRY